MRLIRLAMLAAGALILGSAASAAEPSLRPLQKGEISFAYTQVGVAMEGDFPRFSSQIRFDPSKPEQGSARFEVDLASIDTGSDEGDDVASQPLWFNVPKLPKASFVSSSIKQTAPNRLLVSGQLSIKGRTRAVTAPVSWSLREGLIQFEGAFSINRGDFAIGEGIWADFGTVANAVKIKFKFVVKAT